MNVDWKKWWPDWAAKRASFDGEEIEQAPYMVTVQASHVTGDAALFDSEHRHQGFVALRIHTASRTRNLSRDWIYADKEILEVHMSHAQWAAMISTPNSGTGTPATLQHIFHERVEQPPVDNRTAHYGPELVAMLEKAIKRLDALSGTKLTKAQKEAIRMVKQDIQSNIPFVANSFDEHMEGRTQKARSDIEAHMNAAVQRVGFAALAQSERLVGLLEKKDADQ